jgi:toxin-antitoxin system PIN domain toxin
VLIPDVNFLVYAFMTAMPQHKAARKAWEELLSGDEPVGLAPVVLFGFLRLVTNRKMFVPPLDVESAVELIEGWLTRSRGQLLETDVGYFAQTLRLIREHGAGGNLTTDAQIAALALEHDATVISNDSDFKRFAKVRSKQPF